ncbi:DUF4270 domain-containing protein [Apibacter raozihei]|uniref:DUF4270 domain-containing protein n=1 Tax=Apibacter raozihei TaxID=2500547 RepID=UPI000FE386D6|nr:DUF4270 domain-containing protein [Apibacter raozihei]
MKIFKYELKLLVLSFISITFLLSCENDTTDIGSNLIPDKSTGKVAYVDAVAYNVTNNDSIRADYKTLTNGLVGIFEDNVFGTSTAAFNTQVRLASTNEISGTVQVVDSVVLAIFPTYNSSSSKTKEVSLSGDRIKTVTTYPLSYFLGKTGTSMNLNVHRIETFLESSESQFYSNKEVSVGDLLGTLTVNDSVFSTGIKKTDGTVVQETNTPGYRVKLNTSYFKQNFFDKKGSSDLSDNSRFIQYFKGIRISASDITSKFMFNFPTSTITLIAYYRYKDASTDTEYKSAQYAFTMGSSYNSSLGEYRFDRTKASNQFNQQMSAPDKTSGEEQLFLQGMGGPSINIKLDDTQLAAIKDSVENKGWAVIDAKLKFYIAQEPVSKPNRIYGYNFTQKKQMVDLTSFGSLTGYAFNPVYDFTNNPGYYVLNVTQSIKNIVEKNEANDELQVGIGNFLVNSSSVAIGYYRTSRPYEPFRLVFYGNKTTGDKKLRLEVTYTKN